MPHMMIVGMTESGKTSYAIELCKAYRENGIKTIVLDPLLDPRWEADFITSDYDLFNKVVKDKHSFNCAIFVDESGESIDKSNRDKSQWLATRSRHQGHNVHFIAQKLTQLAPIVRDQCSHLVMFQIAANSRKELSNEWNKPEIEQIELNKGDYIHVRRFGEIKKGNVFQEVRA